MATNDFPIAEAKRTDMVDYLAFLGYQPQKVRGQDYWYLSPFREESTASFKVDRKLNLFYDFGIGQGGSIVDFGMLFHHCTIPEVLEKLQAFLSFHRPQVLSQLSPMGPAPQFSSEEKKIRVIGDAPIASPALLHYLEVRCIPVQLAQQFCREVRYSLYGKDYYAIGFKNDAGGYELRNPYFKGSSNPKATTFIDNGASEVSVYEGFFSFLSFLMIHQGKNLPETNYLVLNSLSFFKKCQELMEKHQVIHLYLDRDKAGISQTDQALALDKKYRDCSQIYGDYKDLNQFLIHSNPSQTVKYSQDSFKKLRRG
ncbi:CHC2 zinc finger domain-containing protein [Chitinophaga sp. 22321]|uniref:Toprim domain-containing protein n=1 Tax=Chitinophaga hostae TaxID=2831022 RepID=A0ABS5JBL8_9BACT|nr:CHC2 zinc finger domain-containing protein [Chitinophaga hostae]MBS0032473.1 toprim domain-containing protein [Chitinophaga hostae]